MSLRYPIPILLALTLGASALIAPGTARADEATPFSMTDVNIFRPEAGFEVLFGQDRNAALAGLQLWLQYPFGERWAITGRLPLAYANFDNGVDGLALGNLTLDGTLF